MAGQCFAHAPYEACCAALAARSQAGYGEFQVTQKSGTRADMSSMYLKPALNRPNLKARLTGLRRGC